MLLCTLSIETGRRSKPRPYAHNNAARHDRSPRNQRRAAGRTGRRLCHRQLRRRASRTPGAAAGGEERGGAGAQAGVILFEPHPREFFQPDKPHFRLTPLARKLELRSSTVSSRRGLRFDAALAGLSPDAFIAELLVGALAARHVVIGHDFRFGKARRAIPRCALGRRRAGFGVTVGRRWRAGRGVLLHAIRAELAQGDVAGAARMLGIWWRISGEVIGGFKRGTGLAFHRQYRAGARNGAGARHLRGARDAEGKSHAGAAYLGTRPTFDDGAPMLEVFLLDFDGDLYGREIAVEFVDYMRADRRFDSAEALKAQMQRDCDRARVMLSKAPGQLRERDQRGWPPVNVVYSPRPPLVRYSDSRIAPSPPVAPGRATRLQHGPCRD